MHMAQLQAQIAEAHHELKRGVDADWRASVLRYPEVLDYFYSLVELKLPSERSPRVVEPPFAVAGYQDAGYNESRIGTGEKKKKKRRERERSAAPAERGRRDRDRDDHMFTVAQRLRGPPPVPTPPIQPGYPPPPMPGSFYH